MDAVNQKPHRKGPKERGFLSNSMHEKQISKQHVKKVPINEIERRKLILYHLGRPMLNSIAYKLRMSLNQILNKEIDIAFASIVLALDQVAELQDIAEGKQSKYLKKL